MRFPGLAGATLIAVRTAATAQAASPLDLVAPVAEYKRRIGPWLLWRGTRLDRHAGPLARLSPFTFQHVLAARRA